MNSAPAWLLTGRVQPPDPSPAHVQRPGLLRRAEERGWQFVAVKAPGGFGKTTLLAELCRRHREQGRVAAWLTAEEGDTTESFGLYLVHAFECAGLPLAEPYGATGNRLAGLIREIAASRRPCLLVIDEAECFAAEVVEALNQVIRQAPRNLNLMFGFRYNPGLELANLILDGRGIEIDADTLRFSTEDIAAWYEHDLSRRELGKLAEQTDGWAIALSLFHHNRARTAAADAARSADAGELAAETVAVDWMENRLLRHLSAQHLGLLLDAAQFHSLDAEILEEVWGKVGAGHKLAVLDELEGLATPREAGSPVIQLNPLLRAYCDTRLRRGDPDRYRQLNVEIAEALVARGRLIDAARHAHKAGDPDLFAQNLLQAGGLRLFLRQGMAGIGDLLAMLTDEVTDRYPRLAMLRCRMLVQVSQMGEARMCYERARLLSANFMHDPAGGDAALLTEDSVYMNGVLIGYGCLPIHAHIIDDQIDTHLRLLGKPDADPAIVIGNTMLAMGGYEAAAMFEPARALGEEAEAALLRVNAPQGTVYTSLNLGAMAMAAGRTAEAERLYARADRLADEHFAGYRGLREVINVLAVELSLHRNRWDDVRQLAPTLPVPYRNGNAWHGVIAAAHDVIVAWRYDAGGLESAMNVLSTLRDASEAGFMLTSYRHLSGLQVSYLVQDGRLEEASDEWLRAGLPEQPDELLPLNRQSWREMESLCCARLRLLIASNRLDAARSLAEGLSALANERGLLRTRMRCLVLRMLLEHRSGELDDAATGLVTFLRLLPETDFYGLMLRETAANRILPEVLEHARLDEELQQVATSLLRQRTESSDPHAPEFTGREREIMEHLARGLRDKEIARELELTEHGVRYHLRNIYRKTGTTGRGETLNWLAKRGGLDTPAI